ncbi:MAG: hypothetical protein RI894_2327 [Bacteroidota bacterium]|jgi:type IX secretion system PorP/SprF family membrane protein
MKKIYQHIFLAASLLTSTAAWAQDPHLSQFFHAPMHLNPALTGALDADLRFAGHYRSQWGTISTPFNTAAASGEMSIHKGIEDDDQMGVGLFLMNDQAGDGNLRRTQAQLSYAYYKSLGAEGTTFLSLGVQAGFIQSNVDFSKFSYDNQWNGDVVDPSLSSGENVLDRPSFLVPDFSAGIGFQMAATDEVSLYVGGAMFHLNEPNMGMSTGVQRLLNRKIHTYAAADIKIGESFTLSPRVIYARQGEHSELNGGVSGRFQFGRNAINDDPNAFLVGVMYRLDNNDAVYPMVRFDYGPLAFALTYDLNLSKLAAASAAQGGPELAIIYKTNLNGTGTHNSSRKKELPCPKW